MKFEKYLKTFPFCKKGVAYASRKKDRIGKQKDVETPHACQEICAETPNCLYWTWIEKKKRKGKKVCKLRAGVRESGFRRQKENAVSGNN